MPITQQDLDQYAQRTERPVPGQSLTNDPEKPAPYEVPPEFTEKEEALEFGQVLGQFVNAAPGPVLKVMLQVMEKAFDEVTMREEDWTELIKSIEQQAGGDQQQQQQQGQDVAGASPEQLQEMLAQLPPEVKQQVQSAIQSGVSPQKALQGAMRQAANGGHPAAPPQ